MSSAKAMARRYGRSFPGIWAPFVVSWFVLWCVFAFSSHNVQIAPRIGNGWGAIWAAIPLGLMGVLLGLVVAQKDKLAPTTSALAFGAAAAIGAIMLYGPVTASIRGWRDFPPSTTREYRAFLPISLGIHGNGRYESWAARLSRYNISIGITGRDYRFMEDALGKTGDTVVSNDYFCLNVTIQKSGDAVRIMHTTLGVLPPHSVVVCPNRAAGR